MLRNPLATPFSQQGFNILSNTAASPLIFGNDMANLVTYATSEKPNLHYVTRGSQEYKDFIKRLEHNFATNSPLKLSACVFCWGFLTPGQKKRHIEHQQFFVPPAFFRDETHFLKLCQINGKYIQNGKEVKVALINEQSMNVDHSVFGDPEADLDQYPAEKCNPNQMLPYDQFRPKQIHSWLKNKGG